MRIQFHNHDFAFDDAPARSVACNQYASDLVHTMLEDAPQGESVNALIGLISDLTDYWLRSGTTLAMAASLGAPGISLAQAQEMNDFIGKLIGQGSLDVLTPEQAAERQLLQVPDGLVASDGARGSADDASPLVSCGEPVYPNAEG